MSLQQHSPDPVYSSSHPDSDWPRVLQDNHKAQGLLSNAIAHHHQHYEQDDDQIRRGHLHHKSDHYTSDPRAASNGSYNDGFQFSDGENSSDDANIQDDGKPAPKKAGRKPLTTEPANKRKAQNRAAQRAFRERKERYVKSLEDRIKELEDVQPKDMDSQLAEENLSLKVLVQKLETENYFLKEQSFTFDFPISQPGVYSAVKAAAQPHKSSAQERSVLSPTAQQLHADKLSYAGSNSKPSGSDRLPWTPPSSGGDSVPHSPMDKDLGTPERDTISQVSYPDNNAGVVPSRYRNSTPERMTLFSSLLDGTGNTYTSMANPYNSSNGNSLNSRTNNINSNQASGSIFGTDSNISNLDSASPATTMTLFSENSTSPSLEDIVNTPLFQTDKDGNVHFTPRAASMSVPSFTYEQTQALFTDFRDPSDPRDFFSSFDEPIEIATTSHFDVPGLLDHPLLDYTDTFVDMTCASTAAAPTAPTAAPTAPTAAPAKDPIPHLGEDEEALSCPQAWETIAKHPRFDDVDIDELCSELKAKAKCSGHGPMIPVSEVNELMRRLDQ